MNTIIVSYIVNFIDLHHTVEGNPKTRHFDTKLEARRFMQKELEGNNDIMSITLTMQTTTIERELI